MEIPADRAASKAATAAATTQTPPEMMSAVGAPHASVIHPTMSDPSGVPPMNTSMYRLITRPRSSGELASCTDELPSVLKVTEMNPMATSSTANGMNQGVSPSRINPSPTPVAERNSTDKVAEVRRAATSAPTTEPAAITVFNSPYTLAPASKTSLVYADRMIAKLYPKVPTKKTSTIGQSSAGVRRTYCRPSRSRPGPRGASGIRSSSRVRMAANAPMTATKLSALSAKAQPIPTALISTPATAGPNIRPSWKLPELSPTALRTRLFGTISLTNVCRAGLSTTVARPNPSAIKYTCQTCTRPASVSTVSSAARPPITDWVIISSRCLG